MPRRCVRSAQAGRTRARWWQVSALVLALLWAEISVRIARVREVVLVAHFSVGSVTYSRNID
jgi:hypothetical protein